MTSSQQKRQREFLFARGCCATADSGLVGPRFEINWKTRETQYVPTYLPVDLVKGMKQAHSQTDVARAQMQLLGLSAALCMLGCERQASSGHELLYPREAATSVLEPCLMAFVAHGLSAGRCHPVIPCVAAAYQS